MFASKKTKDCFCLCVYVLSDLSRCVSASTCVPTSLLILSSPCLNHIDDFCEEIIRILQRYWTNNCTMRNLWLCKFNKFIPGNQKKMAFNWHLIFKECSTELIAFFSFPNRSHFNFWKICVLNKSWKVIFLIKVHLSQYPKLKAWNLSFFGWKCVCRCYNGNTFFST